MTESMAFWFKDSCLSGPDGKVQSPLAQALMTESMALWLKD